MGNSNVDESQITFLTLENTMKLLSFKDRSRQITGNIHPYVPFHGGCPNLVYLCPDSANFGSRTRIELFACFFLVYRLGIFVP